INMLNLPWKIHLGVLIFVLIEGDLQDARPTTQPNGWQLVNPSLSPESRQRTEFTGKEHLNRRVLFRRKRSILFPSGVKICPDETGEQVIANHLKYFRLRGNHSQNINADVTVFHVILILSVSTLEGNR
uniref:Uncharacterized protein n=1 Tax=Gopherus agassizii TaxID=38772 RepID=A0A452GFF4_9SAUR